MESAYNVINFLWNNGHTILVGINLQSLFYLPISSLCSVWNSFYDSTPVTVYLSYIQRANGMGVGYSGIKCDILQILLYIFCVCK